MPALADLLTPHKPIRLSRQGPGAADTVIYYGVASGDSLLHGYLLGTAEVTRQARIDTARGLVGVPVVSPEDHQGWVRAQQAGADYTERVLGTVIEADYDAATDTVPFRMAIHDRDAIAKIDGGEWPDTSVAYNAKIGDPTHPEADFAQLGRVVRHQALVPCGRDSKAHTLRDASAADGASPMTLDQIKAKHPAEYKRGRAAIRNARRLGIPTADMISLDKAVPLIKEMMDDEIGKLVLHAIVNAPAEMKEIETGTEGDDLSVDPAMANVKPEADKKAMADEIASLKATVSTLRAAVDPLVQRQIAADQATADAALKTRAQLAADALDGLTEARPEGFDPAKPTVAMVDAAERLALRAAAGPRTRYAFQGVKAGKQWNGDGSRVQGTVDAAPTTLHPDEL